MVISDRAAQVNKMANGKIDRNAVAIQIKFNSQIVNRNCIKTLGKD